MARTRKADMPIAERLLARIEKAPDGCWIWTGSRSGGGGKYGAITIGGVCRLPHRVSYEEFVGPIPEGLQVDHLCFTTLCINPAHLEAVTPGENVRRSAARITHCPYGHAYTEDNIRWKDGRRRLCRTCDNARSREYQRRIRRRRNRRQAKRIRRRKDAA